MQVLLCVHRRSAWRLAWCRQCDAIFLAGRFCPTTLPLCPSCDDVQWRAMVRESRPLERCTERDAPY